MPAPPRFPEKVLSAEYVGVPAEEERHPERDMAAQDTAPEGPALTAEGQPLSDGSNQEWLQHRHSVTL